MEETTGVTTPAWGRPDFLAGETTGERVEERDKFLFLPSTSIGDEGESGVEVQNEEPSNCTEDKVGEEGKLAVGGEVGLIGGGDETPCPSPSPATFVVPFPLSPFNLKNPPLWTTK